MLVETVCPFHTTRRGWPTFTEMIFMVPFPRRRRLPVRRSDAPLCLSPVAARLDGLFLVDRDSPKVNIRRQAIPLAESVGVVRFVTQPVVPRRQGDDQVNFP